MNRAPRAANLRNPVRPNQIGEASRDEASIHDRQVSRLVVGRLVALPCVSASTRESAAAEAGETRRGAHVSANEIKIGKAVGGGGGGGAVATR